MIPEEPSPDFIREFAGVLRNSGKKIFVVIGGGKLARKFIGIAREIGCDEGYLDEIGIAATRLNARLLIAALDADCYPVPAEGFDEAIIASRNFKFVIMGGTHPGHTTDGVAAMLAERVSAERMLNATNVKGVYTEDPRGNPEAQLFKHMPPSKLVEIALAMETGAGKSAVLDPLAARLVKRTGIPTLVLDGRDTAIVSKAIDRELKELEREFEGTLIKDGLDIRMEV